MAGGNKKVDGFVRHPHLVRYFNRKMQIDINCDMGESYGNFHIGHDEVLFPYISSANIACGYHGGDPVTISQTIQQAIKHNLAIGAHPSYPDLVGFGRRNMDLAPDELLACVLYQVGAVKSMVESFGGKLHYVKPHGAMYHAVANEEPIANAFFKALKQVDSQLLFLGLAGSAGLQMAKSKSITAVSEAFLDRRYTSDGQLVSRANKNAVITQPKDATEQFRNIVQNQKVTTVDGKTISIKADSLCIHGDNAQAVPILKAIHAYANNNGIHIKPFSIT